MIRSRKHRYCIFHRKLASLALVTEHFQYLRSRSNECQTRFIAQSCKVSVLAQKAVTRMDRVTTGRARDTNDLRRVEIGGRAFPCQAVRFIRFPDMIRLFVVFRIDRV